MKIHIGEKSNQTEIGFVVDLFYYFPPSSCLVSPLFLRHKIHIVSQPRCPCMDVNSDNFIEHGHFDDDGDGDKEKDEEEEDVEGGRGVETPRWSGGVG